MAGTPYPSFFYLWTNGITSEGVSFVWFNPSNPRRVGVQPTGVSIDKLGIAAILDWRLSDREVSFEKQYFPNASLDNATKGVIVNKLDREGCGYLGKYKVRGLGEAALEPEGSVFLQSYPHGVPLYDHLVREMCREAVKNFGVKLGRDKMLSADVKKFKAISYIFNLTPVATMRRLV